MTPEELSRIRRIYEHALALSGRDREDYLGRECQDADGIRVEVERLVQAHGNIPDWLERPALGAAREFPAFHPPALVGRNLNGYTLQA